MSTTRAVSPIFRVSDCLAVDMKALLQRLAFLLLCVGFIRVVSGNSFIADTFLRVEILFL